MQNPNPLTSLEINSNDRNPALIGPRALIVVSSVRKRKRGSCSACKHFMGLMNRHWVTKIQPLVHQIPEWNLIFLFLSTRAQNYHQLENLPCKKPWYSSSVAL